MTARHPAALIRLTRLTITAACAAAALITLTPAVAHAEELRWRQAHAFDRYEGAGYIRRGVAMFRLGGRPEPATLEVRGLMTGPQGDNWFGMRIDLRYRFDDGATLLGQLEGRFQRSADGSISGPQEGQGRFVGGTGRFEGAEGSFRLQGVGGLAGSTPGVLGDVFGALEGDLKLPTTAR